MADYVALTQIGLPDLEHPDSELIIDRGVGITLDPGDEDTVALLAKGAIVEAKEWEAQEGRAQRARYGEHGDTDRQVADARAAEQRQADVLADINARVLAGGAVVQHDLSLVDPDAAQEGAVVFTDAVEELDDEPLPVGPDDHMQAEPTGGAGGEGPTGDSPRVRPPKRSIAQMVEQRRREH